MHEDDFQWLSEQVDDEEIRSLFTDDSEKLKIAVRHLIARAREDVDMERELIDTLDLAIDQGSDDGQVTPWIAVILGETGSVSSLGVLSRCVVWEDDEVLQDAAIIALLRIGSSAVSYLIDEIEEDRGVAFHRAAYRVLGDVGLLDDDVTLRRVTSFLEERYSIEERADPAHSALESLAEAAARLGHRDLLEQLKATLKRKFRGHHPVLEDAIAALEENEDGVPFVPTIPPWEERYGWLYDDPAEGARVSRPGSQLRPEDLSDGYGDLDPLAGFQENPFRTDDDE